MIRIPKLLSCSMAVVSALCVFVSQTLPAAAAGYGLPSNLNLASSQRNIVEPANLPAVQIVAGGHRLTVTGGSAVTPAVAAAVAQVLNTGTQSPLIGSNGSGTGGNLVISSLQSLSALSIPHGVTIVRDFGNTPLGIGGNLSNAGTFYAVST